MIYPKINCNGLRDWINVIIVDNSKILDIGGFGLLSWLFKKDKYKCPRCNHPVNKNQDFCPNCGQPFSN